MSADHKSLVCEINSDGRSPNSPRNVSWQVGIFPAMLLRELKDESVGLETRS